MLSASFAATSCSRSFAFVFGEKNAIGTKFHPTRVLSVLLTLNCGLSTFSESHDVVAAIDVNRLTGNAGAGFGKQKHCRGANLARVHVAFQRRALVMGFEH